MLKRKNKSNSTPEVNVVVNNSKEPSRPSYLDKFNTFVLLMLAIMTYFNQTSLNALKHDIDTENKNISDIDTVKHVARFYILGHSLGTCLVGNREDKKTAEKVVKYLSNELDIQPVYEIATSTKITDVIPDINHITDKEIAILCIADKYDSSSIESFVAGLSCRLLTEGREKLEKIGYETPEILTIIEAANHAANKFNVNIINPDSDNISRDARRLHQDMVLNYVHKYMDKETIINSPLDKLIK